MNEDFPFPIIPPKKQKEFGIVEYILWVIILCIPFLGSVLGFLYIKFADVEKKPWNTFLFLGIFPYVAVMLELFFKKYF